MQAPGIAASLHQAGLPIAASGIRRRSIGTRPALGASLRPQPATFASIPVMPCHLFQIATRSGRLCAWLAAFHRGTACHETLRIVTCPGSGARIFARIRKVHILLQILRRISSILACELHCLYCVPTDAAVANGKGPARTRSGDSGTRSGRPPEGTGARRLSGTGGIQSNRFPGARFAKTIGCRSGELNGNSPFRRRVSAAADERHLKVRVAAVA